MSAAKEAKKIGHISLKDACNKANIGRSTAYYWFHNNRKLFNAVMKGALG